MTPSGRFGMRKPNFQNFWIKFRGYPARQDVAFPALAKHRQDVTM